MTISGSGAEGTESPAAPIVVEKGGTYNMTVSQHSTYTYPDGTAIVREPKASLSLAMTLDTVVCKDLKELTAMTSSVKTASHGSSPQLNSTVQTFNVGGQEITFNTAYEIYKIVNVAGKTIEMPYVRMNAASNNKEHHRERLDGIQRQREL